MKRLITIRAFIGFLMVIAIASIGTSIYFYLQFQAYQKDSQPEVKDIKAEAEQLIFEVGQLIVLPEDEIPTIATVSDLEKLRDQPFFAKAKQGDKVLIYTNAGKAILYDPVAHKIIEIAQLNIGNVSEP